MEPGNEKPAHTPCLTCDAVEGGEPRLDGLRCCNETCIDQVADRQCAIECGLKMSDCCGNPSTTCTPKPDMPTSQPSSQLGKRKRGACTEHSRKARKDFAEVLRRVGCICKELISRNWQPCCGGRLPAGPHRAAMAPTGSTGSLILSSQPHDEVTLSCCEKGGIDDAEVPKSGCCTDGKRKLCRTGSRGGVPGTINANDDACAAAEKGYGSTDHNATSRCVDTERTATGTPSSCCDGDRKPSCVGQDSCCGVGSCEGDGKSRASEGDAALASVTVHEQKGTARDPEKGAPALAHVSLTVEGLTCVGCETKLYRALRALHGVHNLNTSLVLSKAEFDLDDSAGPVPDLIKAVEKSTGFACRRLENNGQDLAVLIEGDANAFVQRDYPKGVLQLTVVDKRTVCVTFDPTIIGARAIVATAFETQLKLAPIRKSADLESGQKHVRHSAWFTLVSALFTIPVLVLAWAQLPPHPIAYGAASLALATAVQFLIGGQFYVSALKALLFTRVIEMDLLVVLSTSTAYIFSIVAFAYQAHGTPLRTEEFFQTSTLLVTLIMLGRLVSAFARQKAVESTSIRSLQTQTAVLCDAGGGSVEEIDARLLQHGDFFKIAPDSRVTTDGFVVMGSSEVNESMVTGEALPIEKHPGSSVIAGSINGSGVMTARLTNLPGQNTISTIAGLVDEAKFQKPKTQEMVDKVAGGFVPVILAITLVTLVVWIAVGVAVRHQGGGEAVVTAITYAVTVLIISCPCAIGLCVPMIVVVAGGVAAKHGVIFKSAIAFESARKVSHVVFDKTGTLTQGNLNVVEVIIFADEQQAATLTLGLTSNSKHPISVAISQYLETKGITAASVQDVRSVTGKGVEGTYAGEPVRCGNTRWLSLEDKSEVQDLQQKGLTVFGISIGDRPLAIFGLSDTTRAETEFVLAELKKRNIAISLISGDDAGPTELLAAELGIPSTNVRSRCTPASKQAYIAEKATETCGSIVFCGDGTNDAVALAQADVGVHMSGGGGSDVAQTAADIVLVRGSLTGLLLLLDLSRAAMRRVVLNFAWSFVYNLVAVLLAAGAFVHARIPPQYAGLGEIVSVLPVILIALQLRWFKRSYPV